MDSKTDSIVKQCLLYQAATPQHGREPLEMSQLPEYAWEKVSIKFCHIGNEYTIVIIYDYRAIR